MSKSLRSYLSAALAAFIAFGAMADEPDLAEISTAKPNASKEPIYNYTGITVNDEGLTVGCSMKFSAAMLSPYRGGKIVSVRCAFGDAAKASPVEFYIRKGAVNAENVISTEISANFGWNTVTFTPVDIPATNTEDFYVGYTCKPPKGGYFIYCSTYGGLKEDECFVCPNADAPLAQQEWVDMLKAYPKDPYPLLLFITVEMPDGSLEDILTVERSVHNNVGIAGSTGSQFLTVANGGTNDIKSMELSMTQGEKSWTYRLDLETALAGGTAATVNIVTPFNYLASGDVKMEVTKVNDRPNNAGEGQRSVMASLVAVPEEVAENFTKRPVLELITSETQYRGATNYANCIEPTHKAYGDKITEIIHHHIDQYSMNVVDEYPFDDALRLIYAYTDNMDDPRYPCMWLDRCDQVSNPLILTGIYKATVCYDYLFPESLIPVFNEALNVPTFASLNLVPVFDAAERTVKLTVNGNITPGILPEGEVPTLHVYLIEKNVPSTSQELPDSEWTDENYPADPTTGLHTYIQPSVIRMMPTPLFGEDITETGEFTRTYDMELEARSWKAEDLRCVAFIQRPMSPSIRNRDIINSAEVPVIESSIRNINADAEATAPEFFNINGMRVDRSNLTPGIYVVRNGKTCKKIIVK